MCRQKGDTHTDTDKRKIFLRSVYLIPGWDEDLLGGGHIGVEFVNVTLVEIKVYSRVKIHDPESKVT